jgi:toxin HigB-1
MIKSFKHKGLRQLYEDGDRRKIRADLVERMNELLSSVDTAKELEKLNRPSFRLHALKGELKEFHAVTVRANWRLIFRFENGDAYDLDLVDYH